MLEPSRESNLLRYRIHGKTLVLRCFTYWSHSKVALFAFPFYLPMWFFIQKELIFSIFVPIWFLSWNVIDTDLFNPPFSGYQTRVSTSGWSTTRGVGSFSGQGRANRVKGASRAAGELCERIFALFCFFFCVCKNWIPPHRSLVKFWYPPLETSSETGTPPSKRITPPYEKFWTVPKYIEHA